MILALGSVSEVYPWRYPEVGFVIVDVTLTKENLSVRKWSMKNEEK